MTDREDLRRWRLMLGPHAEPAGPAAGPGSVPGLADVDRQRDEALQYLYGRERRYRRVAAGVGGPAPRGAGDERGTLTPVTWLGKVRKLFPRSSAETLQRTAIERYGLTTLLSDPQVLGSMTPSLELVSTLMSFRSSLRPEVMGEVRRIIAAVVRDLEQRLGQKVRQSFGARRLRHLHRGRPVLQNLDWRQTVRRNLKHYDAEHQALVLERLYFNPRERDRIPWHVLLVVDQSGSMAESVIHGAVIASAFKRVRSLETRLLVFDTEVIDLTETLDDPVETLLSVHLGGGTDIARAMAAVATLVTAPRRSIVVLVTDFDEGGSVRDLLRQVRSLQDSGVKLLGLAALTDEAEPYLNRTVADRVAEAGMTIGSVTPDRLAAWVADQIG